MDTQNIKNTLQSKRYHKIVVYLLCGLCAFVIFTLGMQVGFMKASFNYRGGENYYRAFGPAGDRHTIGLLQGGVSEAHGLAGTIISINLPLIVVADRDNTEKVITVSDDTVLRKFRNVITAAELQTGDAILVLGEPNDGAQVEAKFIRVMPAPEITIPLPPVEVR